MNAFSERLGIGVVFFGRLNVVWPDAKTVTVKHIV